MADDDEIVRSMLRHSLTEEATDFVAADPWCGGMKDENPPAGHQRFGWLGGATRSDSEDHLHSDYGWFKWEDPEEKLQAVNRRKAALAAPIRVDSVQLRHERLLMNMGMERPSPTPVSGSPSSSSPFGWNSSATEGARAAEAAVHACGRNGGHVIVATRSFVLLPGRWPDDADGGASLIAENGRVIAAESAIHGTSADFSFAFGGTDACDGGRAGIAAAAAAAAVPEGDDDDEETARGCGLGLKGDKRTAATLSPSAATLSLEDVQKVVFAVAISSVRIVGASTSQHAEYQVVLTSGPNQVLSSWKRFKNFVSLASQITATRKLPRSEYAWENVQRSRKWYRCLEEDYLRAKSVSLSIFLGQVLFEVDSPKLLTDFVRNHSPSNSVSEGSPLAP